MQLAAEQSYSTPLSNSPLLPLLLLSLARQKNSPGTGFGLADEYDYVIVGAGSAGSVVASRLLERPCVTVLLLEAGPEPPLLTEVPVLAKYFLNSDVDWKYKSVPQKHSGKGYVNRQLPWSAGKMLGGSSSLNFNFYVRGNMKNYDDWEDMGAKGWNYEEVYPYFIKLEDNKDPKFLADGFHGFGGPITVEQPKYHPELRQATHDAAVSLGYKIVDSNAAKQTGFYDPQATLRDSQRCSTAKAYLVPFQNRTNFNILANAMVKKILIKDGRATGVQFDFDGNEFEVKASREVILSAGAINTPQILKLSGVGPKKELEKLKIPVVVDLPGVGENLQSHSAVDYPFLLKPSIPNIEERIKNPENIKEYINNRTGLLSSTAGYYYTGFLKGMSILPCEDFPTVQIVIGETTAKFLKGSGLRPEVYKKLYGPYENETIFICVVDQLQPKSRGTIKLKSTNPYDSPLIDPNYLNEFEDIREIMDGLKACRRLLSTDPFRKLGATPLETRIPGCEKHDDEYDYLYCQIETMLYSFLHIAGTAKMGNLSDPMTVVDPKLRVKNIKGLRVVDASVMPRIPSGNTNIPTIMIAEKASDIIKEEIKCFGRDRKFEEEIDFDDIDQTEPVEFTM